MRPWEADTTAERDISALPWSSSDQKECHLLRRVFGVNEVLLLREDVFYVTFAFSFGVTAS